MVKKLRYYARFIVVCLLLKKMKLVRDLVRDLTKQVEDYTSTYEPEDHMEWSIVLGEIKSFVEAENLVKVSNMDNIPLVLSHRLSLMNMPPMENISMGHLSLQEILIIGNCSEQVKFSELTLDMFRMLQTLEREPQEDIGQMYDASPAPGRVPFENGDHPLKRDNPHKYLLYRPTFSQFIVFLSSGFKELPPNGALLLYISADSAPPVTKYREDLGYGNGGVVTSNKREIEHCNKRGLSLREMHCLHPGDLYPFTRKPLFLIIDSENSYVFQNIPNLFGQPMVALMSAEITPKHLMDTHHKGNLFTLFLHSPLTAFCFICKVSGVPITSWEKGRVNVDRFLSEAGRLITRSRGVDSSYIQFYNDDFLRLLLLRFIFCYVVMKMHKFFKGRSNYPRCYPMLPESEILENATLQKCVLDLANLLECRGYFYESGEAD
ncbi:Protein SCAI [Nymphon striatum]|nr:Protein SCAI [Nymphon striatum]